MKFIPFPLLIMASTVLLVDESPTGSSRTVKLESKTPFNTN